jgi:TPP-dependent pyruvate/acetoin dehydrogenase alpha subunit
LTEKAPHENPLVPNAKLQQMFVAMVEMRMLDEHINGLQRGVKARRRLGSTHGQEACRVSTALGLTEGDLISDCQAGVAMGLVSGVKTDSLLQQATALVSAAKKPEAVIPGGGHTGRQMPLVQDAEDRLRMAMGAALSFKTLKRANLVAAYVDPDDLSSGEWKRILALAGQFELPIMFVVLPARKGEESKGDLRAKARSYGVPGIPVDAADAVALYRVAQESIGRMRIGGGPVLIECKTYRIKSKSKAMDDPLMQMRAILLGRKICSEAWLDRVGDALHKRIVATKTS